MSWVLTLMKMKLKPFLDKERKKKVRSITGKFKSWKVRAAFCKARQKKLCK